MYINRPTQLVMCCAVKRASLPTTNQPTGSETGCDTAMTTKQHKVSIKYFEKYQNKLVNWTTEHINFFRMEHRLCLLVCGTRKHTEIGIGSTPTMLYFFLAACFYCYFNSWMDLITKLPLPACVRINPSLVERSFTFFYTKLMTHCPCRLFRCFFFKFEQKLADKS